MGKQKQVNLSESIVNSQTNKLTHVSMLCACIYCFSGLQYYMVLSGIVGNWREQAKLKLLLSDRFRQGAFCVRFSYRITGLQTNTLRMMMENGKSHYILWEQRHNQDDGWHMETVDVVWSDRAPESVWNSARFS